jgi:hypothetical protein
VGCRQITPHLVRLASRLQDKPFHIVASHCQDTSSRKEVIAYLRNNNMSAFAPNMTITKNGRHPDVPGNGYVPYYIVFDHTGKLVHHHMCGSYHGGDGLEMIEWVEKLLKDAPEIYLGAEPFKRIAPLASKVSSGKNLGTAVKAIEGHLATAPDEATKAELDRLHAIVTQYRDQKLARLVKMQGSQPSEVIKEAKSLAKTFKGTKLAAEVDTALAGYEDSETLATGTKMEKAFRKIAKSFEKVKEAKRTDALIEKTVKKLEKLLEGNGAVPFAQTIEAFLKDLR